MNDGREKRGYKENCWKLFLVKVPHVHMSSSQLCSTYCQPFPAHDLNGHTRHRLAIHNRWRIRISCVWIHRAHAWRRPPPCTNLARRVTPRSTIHLRRWRHRAIAVGALARLTKLWIRRIAVGSSARALLRKVLGWHLVLHLHLTGSWRVASTGWMGRVTAAAWRQGTGLRNTARTHW